MFLVPLCETNFHFTSFSHPCSFTLSACLCKYGRQAASPSPHFSSLIFNFSFFIYRAFPDQKAGNQLNLQYRPVQVITFE